MDAEQGDVTKLHALCLMQMSQFMLEPTAAQAARVSALLQVLRQHDNRYRPDFGCDPYTRARAIWIRVAQHIESTEAAPECAMNDEHWHWHRDR